MVDVNFRPGFPGKGDGLCHGFHFGKIRPGIDQRICVAAALLPQFIGEMFVYGVVLRVEADTHIQICCPSELLQHDPIRGSCDIPHGSAQVDLITHRSSSFHGLHFLQIVRCQ